MDGAGSLRTSLPRTAYVEGEWFEAERRCILWAEWFAAGREEETPEEGQFRVVDVAGERILIVRGRDGVLRALVDLCRHRGCRLALDHGGEVPERPGPSGRFRGAIRCPYHGWTYGLDGSLRAAPFLPGGEPLDGLSLIEVDVGLWGGFVFLRVASAWGEPGEPLADRLGPVPARLRRYPLAELRTGARLRYRVAANWKVIAENYNECYHCGPVHPELCQVVPAFRRGGAGLDWEAGIPHRNGAWTFTRTGRTARRPFPGLHPEERTRHKGELVYPNLMLSLSPDHVAAFTLWPCGPGLTTVVCDLLFHPDEMARPGFDPTDAAEFWDLVNRQDWRVCQGVQDGMSSRAFVRGLFAPMEDPSMDIRRYVEGRLGLSTGER